MSCHACQKTPAEYLEQKEWIHQNEGRYYTPNLIAAFYAANPLYEYCFTCNEGHPGPFHHMKVMEHFNKKIEISLLDEDDPEKAATKPVQKKKKQKRNIKPLRQFKRSRKNPAHSNRHIYTMKDMRA